MRIREPGAFACELVEMRCRDLRVGILNREITKAHVVSVKDHDVWPARRISAASDQATEQRRCRQKSEKGFHQTYLTTDFTDNTDEKPATPELYFVSVLSVKSVVNLDWERSRRMQFLPRG